ncbi:MAG: mechanosensitive ion channel [Acidobacteria bacterium]|nr:mechanosensitive ion channel [Acidobacteriota bacterium]
MFDSIKQWFFNLYDNYEWFSHIVLPLAIIFLGYFFARFLSWAIIKIGSKLSAKTETTLDDRIFPIFNPPLRKLLFVIVIYFALIVVPGDYEIVNFLRAAVMIIIILYVTILIVRVFKTFILWYREVMAPKTESQFDDEFLPLFQKVGVIILYTVGIIWILDTGGVNVSGLIVSLGVGGMALGLAAKDALANMIAGFMLMIDRPFREGDRIELSNGKIGDVLHLGIRTTRIKTFDNTIIIVPNQELLQDQVTNHNYPDSVVKKTVDVGVAYGTDLKKAKEIMLECAQKHEKVINDPAPAVFVINFGDSSMDLRLNFWVQDLRDGFATQCDLIEHVYEAFGKKGIDIPFPIRTVYLHNQDKK